MANKTFLLAADHPALAGHFPGRPLAPAAVVLAEVIDFAEQFLQPTDSGVFRIRRAKFLSPLLAGELCTIELNVVSAMALDFRCHVAKRVIAVGELDLSHDAVR